MLGKSFAGTLCLGTVRKSASASSTPSRRRCQRESKSTPSSTTTQPTSIRRYANGWPGIPAGPSTSPPHRMLDLNDLRVFERVADLRSFSAAARALGLPKSTVSRSVARLEDALAARLLQRTTREVQLTAAGEVLRGKCAEMLGRVSEAVELVNGLAGKPARDSQDIERCRIRCERPRRTTPGIPPTTSGSRHNPGPKERDRRSRVRGH
jgi:molybdenum-dependent DNA-binding transcriptional regulator ModE